MAENQLDNQIMDFPEMDATGKTNQITFPTLIVFLMRDIDQLGPVVAENINTRRSLIYKLFFSIALLETKIYIYRKEKVMYDYESKGIDIKNYYAYDVSKCIRVMLLLLDWHADQIKTFTQQTQFMPERDVILDMVTSKVIPVGGERTT